jgi:hypothetical protein
LEKETLAKLDEIIQPLKKNQSVNRENSKLLQQNRKALESITEKLHDIANGR